MNNTCQYVPVYFYELFFSGDSRMWSYEEDSALGKVGEDKDGKPYVTVEGISACLYGDSDWMDFDCLVSGCNDQGNELDAYSCDSNGNIHIILASLQPGKKDEFLMGVIKHYGFEKYKEWQKSPETLRARNDRTMQDWKDSDERNTFRVLHEVGFLDDITYDPETHTVRKPGHQPVEVDKYDGRHVENALKEKKAEEQ